MPQACRCYALLIVELLGTGQEQVGDTALPSRRHAGAALFALLL
jgi:hypothetical protein